MVYKATFWTKDVLNLPSGETLKVNSACTIIVESISGSHRVHVSDPHQNGGKLKVEIADKTHII